jgi:hypothetical protein
VNRSLTPAIQSTAVRRCTIFRHNRIVANNNSSAPANTSSLRPAAGIGIALLGAYGDLFADNLVAGNRNVGILALEQPYLHQKRPWPARFQMAVSRFDRQVIVKLRRRVDRSSGGTSGRGRIVNGASVNLRPTWTRLGRKRATTRIGQGDSGAGPIRPIDGRVGESASVGNSCLHATCSCNERSLTPQNATRCVDAARPGSFSRRCRPACRR